MHSLPMFPLKLTMWNASKNLKPKIYFDMKEKIRVNK